MNIKSILLAAAIAASPAAYAFDWTGYVSISPAPGNVEGKEAFNNLVINYGTNEISVDTSAGLPTLTASDGVVTTASSAALWDMMLEATGSYILKASFPSLPSFGQYTLTIPAGMMKAGTEGCPQLTFNYNVTDPNAGLELPPLELISVTPAAGSALEGAGTADGFTYTIDTNLNSEIAFIMVDWVDVTDPDNEVFIANTQTSHLDAEGNIPSSPLVITKVSMGGEEFYQGHNYEMRVYCYNTQAYNRQLVGELTISYTGTREAYVYSTIQLISVAPDPDSYRIDEVGEGKFYLKYSGPVTIDLTKSGIPAGIGYKASYESVTPNDDNTEYTFVIPADVLEQFTEVNCYVVARDSEGRTVLPSPDLTGYANGKDDDAGVMITYHSNLSGLTLDVTPAGGTVEQLKNFRVTCTADEKTWNIFPAWSGQYPYIVKEKEMVYKFNLENDMEYDMEAGWDDPITWLDLVLPAAITDPGRYALVIPSQTFSIDDMAMDYRFNKECQVFFTIEENNPGGVVYDLMPIGFTPAPGQVEEIAHIMISFGEDVDLGLWDAYLEDAEGVTLQTTDIEFDDDWDNMTDYHFNFTSVTEDGTYVLYIPEGTFGDLDWSNSWMQEGHANPDLRVTYTINAVGVSLMSVERVVGDVYNTTGTLVLRNATEAQIKTLEKGIYVVKGRKLVVK